MSAESYAEDQFNAALADWTFVRRIHDAGASIESIVVCDSSTPVAQILGRVNAGHPLVAMHDECEPHGFVLFRIVVADPQ